MAKYLKVFFVFSLFSLLYISVYSIEIPLDKEVQSGITMGVVDMEKIFKESDRVAGIKKEFEKIKNERDAEIKNKEIGIQTLQNEIKELELKIEDLKKAMETFSTGQAVEYSSTSITGNAISVSTPPVVLETISYLKEDLSGSTQTLRNINPPSKTRQNFQDSNIKKKEMIEIENQIEQKKKDLEIRNEELTKRKKEIEKELKDFEYSKTLKVMADYYSVIEEIAREENIKVIIEKSGLLYGIPEIDLTEKVKDRMRGR